MGIKCRTSQTEGQVLVLALMIACVCCMPPTWLCTGEVPVDIITGLDAASESKCVVVAGPTPVIVVYHGYPVTVCVIATHPCICSAVEVNGVSTDQCQHSDSEGFLLATYSVDSAEENLSIRFAFYDSRTKSTKYVWSNMTIVIVEEVVVYNVTTSNSYDRVQVWWLSSPTDNYRVRVECANGFHNFTTPYANATLQLVDYWDNSVCSVYLSAATPVGWGPETNTTVCFYEATLKPTIDLTDVPASTHPTPDSGKYRVYWIVGGVIFGLVLALIPGVIITMALCVYCKNCKQKKRGQWRLPQTIELDPRAGKSSTQTTTASDLGIEVSESFLTDAVEDHPSSTGDNMQIVVSKCT